MITTIEGVINKLEEIIEISIVNKSRMGYFAALYKRMTIAVKKGIDAGAFEDGTRMERLDIIFANRYLDAYDAYQKGKALSECWSKAFDTTQLNSITVIQHLILGINAHINLDLGIAAAETMKGQPIENLKNDFNKINSVIGDLVNEVQDELSAISYPMKFIDKVCNNNDEAVIGFSITIARNAAWRLATSLAALSQLQQDALIQKTDNTIAFIASKIIKPGLWLIFLLKLVKWMEWNDTVKIIRVLIR